VDSSDLKRDGDIILQPQPSDSPNDPLNWLVSIQVTAPVRCLTPIKESNPKGVHHDPSRFQLRCNNSVSLTDGTPIFTC
jgi:hypothetical protein